MCSCAKSCEGNWLIVHATWTVSVSIICSSCEQLECTKYMCIIKISDNVHVRTYTHMHITCIYTCVHVHVWSRVCTSPIYNVTVLVLCLVCDVTCD